MNNSVYKSLRISEIVQTISLTHNFDKDKLIAINTSDVYNGVMGKGTLTPVEELKGQFKKTIQKDDILFSEIRPANRRFAIVTNSDCSDFVVSTKLMVLRKFNEDVDSSYFYYCLTNQPFLDILQRRAENRIGSFPQITYDLLANYAFPIPPLEEQKRISKIIANIDRKIELNRQINDNLEAMAKQLYDYWFVQFDFPNEEGKPYKTSGGEMVWNEKLKREIPKGWKSTTLGDECQMYQPKTLGLSELDESAIYKVYGANGVVGKYHAYNHENSEIAMACRGNSCGTINRTAPFSWITGNAMVIKMIDDSIHNEYIKQALRYANVNGAISGSGQPQLTRENLSSIKLCKPTRKLIMRFSEQVSNIVEMYLQNEANIEELTKQRDELLPLLMNGQATVNYHLSDD